MTGARLNFTLDEKGYRAKVTALGGILRPGNLAAIGTALVEQVQRRFESGKDPFGQAWAPLLPDYAAIKRGPGILRESRMLQRSQTFHVRGSSVIVGTNRIYGAVQQFGATITAKHAPALSFRLGAGGRKGTRLVHAHSVHIPARPYLGFGPDDQRATMEVLQVFVARTLRS